MATKKKTPKKKTKKMSDRERKSLRFLWGVVLVGIGLMMLFACVSYYFTWSDDYTWLHSGIGTPHNTVSGFGARVASWLVGNWFGLLGVAIPIVFILWGIRVMNTKRTLYVERSVKFVAVVMMAMILGSVTLSLLFGHRGEPPVFGTGVGGAFGNAVSGWMLGHLYSAGTTIVMIILWVALAVYISDNTITIINGAGEKTVLGAKGFFAWLKRRREARALAREEHRVIAEQQRQEREQQEREEREQDEKKRQEIEQQAREQQQTQIQANSVTTDTSGYIIRAVPVVDDIQPASPQHPQPTKTIVDENGFIISVSPIIDTMSLTQNVGVSDQLAENKMVGAGGIMESTGDGGMRVVSRSMTEDEAEEFADIYDPTKDLSHYQRPPVELLSEHSSGGVQISESEIRANKSVIRQKFGEFGVNVAENIKATVGPTVTLYEVEPAEGVKVSRIRSLDEDIALALKMKSVRIANMGAGHGTVGIEVPNSTREVVSMLSVIRSAKFQECKYKLPVALGRTIHNEVYIADLAEMPHLLIAGSTGQGKSVGLNAIITSLLYKKHPSELKFVMVDPKQVELSVYARLEKHFLAKMESEEQAILTDTQRVVNTVNSLINLMEQRYTLLREGGERNIADYNAKFLNRRLNPNKGHHFMPYIVVVIDEFADMIMTAGKEIETPIVRLAQKARAVGIHLIVATQRPEVKVITGLIKANFPVRMAFKVMSTIDSNIIMGQPGANNLLGKGDMLIVKNDEPVRVQCAFIDTPEIERISRFIGNQQGYASAYELPDYVPEDKNAGSVSKDSFGKLDDKFEEIARWVVSSQEGSTSAIQRNFEIGYNRAGRITDQLEKAGIVGKSNGPKPREVLIYDVATLERVLSEIM